MRKTGLPNKTVNVGLAKRKKKDYLKKTLLLKMSFIAVELKY